MIVGSLLKEHIHIFLRTIHVFGVNIHSQACATLYDLIIYFQGGGNQSAMNISQNFPQLFQYNFYP